MFFRVVAYEIWWWRWLLSKRGPACHYGHCWKAWANQGWVWVSLGRQLSFSQVEGQKSKWWDGLLMEIEMKVCINLPPLLILIIELSHLPIFPDMHRLSNEDGCCCNEYQHMWGLASARVGVWKSLQRWGDSPLGWGPWWGPGVCPWAPISLPLACTGLLPAHHLCPRESLSP